MKRVRVVIAGSGLMGRWHAHAAVRERGEIVAIVDPKLSRAELLAGAHRAAVYEELDAALAANPADVVHVCAPLGAHEDLVDKALAGGCHVLCEKPLAHNAAATGDLLSHAASAKRLLCPVYQFLFQRGAMRAMRILPDLEPLNHLDLVVCSAGADGLESAERDRLVGEILPHPLSLFAAFLPIPLEEVAWEAFRPEPGELRVIGRAGNASVHLLVSMHGRPTRNVLRLITGDATVHVDLFHGFCVVERGSVSRWQKVLRPFAFASQTLGAASVNLGLRAARREPAYPGLRELTRRFYLAIREGGASPIGPSETRAVARARDLLLSSV